jgi:hypothetical protein
LQKKKNFKVIRKYQGKGFHVTEIHAGRQREAETETVPRDLTVCVLDLSVISINIALGGPFTQPGNRITINSDLPAQNLPLVTRVARWYVF